MYFTACASRGDSFITVGGGQRGAELSSEGGKAQFRGGQSSCDKSLEMCVAWLLGEEWTHAFRA
eukprot:9474319-Pyramimonas_sp.AAC.1